MARLGVEHPEVTITTLDRLERSDGPAKLKRFIPLPAAQLPAHRGQDGSTAPATEAATTLTRYAAAG